MTNVPITENITRQILPTNQNLAETLWTVPEVAKYLRLTPQTIRSMARQAKIPSIKMGRSYRFRVDDIQNWLKSQSK